MLDPSGKTNELVLVVFNLVQCWWERWDVNQNRCFTLLAISYSALSADRASLALILVRGGRKSKLGESGKIHASSGLSVQRSAFASEFVDSAKARLKIDVDGCMSAVFMSKNLHPIPKTKLEQPEESTTLFAIQIKFR